MLTRRVSEEGVRITMLVPPIDPAAIAAFRARIAALVLAAQAGPRKHVSCYDAFTVLISRAADAAVYEFLATEHSFEAGCKVCRSVFFFCLHLLCGRAAAL